VLLRDFVLLRRDDNRVQVWEGGIRMPGAVVWPGTIMPGSVSSTPGGCQGTVWAVAFLFLKSDRFILFFKL
jgi:hypothetical protein